MTELTLKKTKHENKLSSLESAVYEVQEFLKDMKPFKKGGLMVI